jgi:hypothetical protein
MRRAIIISLAALAMGALGACADASIGDPEGSRTGGQDQDTVTGLLIEENTDTITRGQYVTQGGRVSFFAVSSADTMMLRAQLNGKTFEVIVDGSVTVDGHGAVLTAEEKALLQALGEALRSRVETVTTGASRIDQLATLGSYLSEAPAGYVHLRLVNGQVLPEGVAPSAGNGVVTCFRSGSTGKSYVTSYTAPAAATLPINTSTSKKCPTPDPGILPGSNICANNAGVAIAASSPAKCRVTKTVVIGSDWGHSVCGLGNYGCMGLCGGGCSGTKYTLECLKHDVCSHDAASTTAGSDPSCGDEYSAASDDMFGGCTTTITLP